MVTRGLRTYAACASGNVAATTLAALTPQRPLNRYPEFKGSVAAVYTHPLENTPGSSGAHYGKDALTYMNVGQAMGQAMVALEKGGQ